MENYDIREIRRQGSHAVKQKSGNVINRAIEKYEKSMFSF